MTGAMQPDPAQLADEIETHGLVCVACALDGDEAAESLIVRALRLMAEPAPAEADDAARLKEAARGALAAIHAAILVGGYRAVTTSSSPPSRSDGSPSR